MISIDELNQLISQSESKNIEFKTAKHSFNEDKELPDYCAAIANESGGYLILGVDGYTHTVVGTIVYSGTLEKRSHELLTRLKIRVDAEEIKHPNGRVVIFIIPSHPAGQAICSNGRYLMRAGESLTEMDSQTLKRILNETELDFSAKIAPDLNINDLDSNAIEQLKKRWIQKTGKKDINSYSVEKILRSLELLNDSGINFAGLIILGKKEKIDALLPCAEIILEWRQVPKKIAYDFRQEWREPFMNIYDQI